MFRPGRRIAMLNLIETKYGYAFAEGTDQMLVTSIENGITTLQSLIQAGLISREEYDKDSRAMYQRELPKTEADFYRCFTNYRVPKSVQIQPYLFATCACDAVPLVHGMVTLLGQAKSPHLMNLDHGFMFLNQEVMCGSMDAIDGVLLMQQMVAARLAINDLAWKKKFASLSEKDQLAYYRRFAPIALFGAIDHEEIDATNLEMTLHGAPPDQVH